MRRPNKKTNVKNVILHTKNFILTLTVTHKICDLFIICVIFDLILWSFSSLISVQRVCGACGAVVCRVTVEAPNKCEDSGGDAKMKCIKWEFKQFPE